MKVSYSWLKEYLDNSPSLEEVSNILNLHAFEVEGVEGDIIDVDVLPNRAHDCLCHTGIAKEIAINSDAIYRSVEINDSEADFDTKFKVNIEDTKCRRYVLREIKNIEVKESPKELKEKLEAIGQKSINNVVDVTNFVMFEINQPLHAFDTSKIEGDIINIRLSKKGEKIMTLDGKDIELDNETLLIADSEPLALAGIKGGNKAEVDQNTNSILLESANFVPVNTRKTSQDLGIATDSSKRFENEITPELALRASERATELILKYCSTKETQVSNIVDVYPKQPSPYYTGVSIEEVNRLLGLDLSEKDISQIFDRLGFEYEYLNTKEFVLNEIKKHVGKKHNVEASLTYDAPREFDCSTLTAYVYAHGGLSIPRMTIDQLFFGTEILEEDLEPGDLIFSNTETGKIKYETIEFLPGNKFDAGVDHVGIYVGEGKVIHSTRNKGVVIEEKISESESFRNVIAYRRLTEKDQKRFVIRIPDERLDLRGAHDLIEEIGRVYGYGSIEERPIEGLNKEKVEKNKEYSMILWIKSELQKLGFSEVFTSSFAARGDLKVTKPLAEDKAFLRPSLEQGIKSSLDMGVYNADLIQADKIMVYEIGKVYKDGEEKLVLGLGVENKNIKKPKPYESINDALEILNISNRAKEGDKYIEIELNTDLLGEKGDVQIEFNNDARFRVLSQYPFITRDIAVWVDDGKGDKQDVFDVIDNHGGFLMMHHRLFDEFSKDGRTSYAIRIVFQSVEKTLTDKEVEEVMDKIYSELSNKEGFEIR